MNQIALERFWMHFNFEPMVFPAADSRGVSIYYTNVLMRIGTDRGGSGKLNSRDKWIFRATAA